MKNDFTNKNSTKIHSTTSNSRTTTSTTTFTKTNFTTSTFKTRTTTTTTTSTTVTTLTTITTKKELTCKIFSELTECHELNGVCYCRTRDNVDSWESANSLCKRLNTSLLIVDTDEKFSFWNNWYKKDKSLKSWVSLMTTKALYLYDSVLFLDWG